jgi:hypothetical protein
LETAPQLVHEAISRSQGASGSHAADTGVGRDQDMEELEGEEEYEQDAGPKEKQASRLVHLICCCADLTHIEACARLGRWDGARQVLWDVLEGGVRSRAL